MACEQMKWLIQEYISNKAAMTPEEIDFIESHLKECADCRAYFEEMSRIEEALKADDIPIPSDLHQGIMARFENTQGKKKKSKAWIPIISSVAAVFVVALVIQLSAQLSTRKSWDKVEAAEPMFKEVGYDVDMAKSEMKTEEMAVESPRATEDSLNQSGNNMGALLESQKNNSNLSSREGPIVERKIIMRASMGLITETYDELQQNIEQWVAREKGFMEESNTESRNLGEKVLKQGFMRIRVPSETLETFLTYLSSSENKVSYLRKSGEDVTKAYYDTENRAQNYEIQEERLREILKKAEKVEDMLQIESELNRVRMEIEGLRQTLKTWDQLVDYATIELSIEEVEHLKPQVKQVDKNLWDRAKEGLIQTLNRMVRGLENLFISLFRGLPYLIVLAVIVIVAFTIIRRVIRKKK